MVMGISFSRGVLFHDRHVLACAEVKDGVIEVWAEKITLRTIGKLWMRIFFSFPWYYQLFHAALLLYVAAALLSPEWAFLNPWWAAVYGAGFHFVFPRELKKFHGAEHKVFSYRGEKRLDAWEEIGRADIVNDGCSTNLVVCFFAAFLLAVPFVPLAFSVAAGFLGIVLGMTADRILRKYCGGLYRLSRFFQRHLTTKEPSRIHLETAIRSYRQFDYMRQKVREAKQAA
ncbi:DUF1385 domain-containing protein [Brevibacillus composti]|uniref:DUF1385 domain-containing protein n=1 Tax=Brevibacillus composti TaxID=2796470 RepID=A0A7T5EI11_9BACL|nr:DUF1385 domain-containing protein [Brevibacillus composti]QQE72996.1 DUF1385 domain-containing protein [Brevibacillus composti]QUO40074.1 DUF1385 domain-containing protein [Brevibacillus composti]